jgi:hypothetical protein
MFLTSLFCKVGGEKILIGFPFEIMPPKTLNYMAFQSFDFERTLLRLFQKRVVRTKLDIYVLITVLEDATIHDILMVYNKLAPPMPEGGEPWFY